MHSHSVHTKLSLTLPLVHTTQHVKLSIGPVLLLLHLVPLAQSTAEANESLDSFLDNLVI